MRFHSLKWTKPALEADFRAKMAGNARQYWCFRLVFLILMAVAVNLFSSQTNAEPSGAAPVVSGVALPPTTPEMEARLKKLETELRCLVCQNQTLAESPSGLAGDLRREVRILAVSGKTDDEIKTFLQVRYGDFVLYKPPLTMQTVLLWFGPFVLLFGGSALLWWFARSRRPIAGVAGAADPLKPGLSAEDAKRAKDLLGD